ncbi:MAG: response regulator transcription factor [Bacteriovoracaceae bacterium]|nr:response regulator transcription factor [Bacteriovoracaceae bacterium]
MNKLFKILLIDDDPLVFTLIERIILDDMSLDYVANSRQMNKMITKKNYDLFIIDIKLQEENGLELIQLLKSDNKLSSIKVFVLTADKSSVLEVSGQNLDVDEYIFKPFKPIVLQSRIQKYQRLKNKKNNSRLGIGILEIDKSTMKVFIKEKDRNTETQLTSIEYKILICLIDNLGEIVSRKKFSEVTGKPKFSEANRALDMRVSSLRKKLGKASNCIKSVRSIGYKLEI